MKVENKDGAQGPPIADEPAKTAAPKRRWLKWVKRVSIGLAAFLIVVVLLLWLVLASLNRPAVKSRIISLVKDVAGLDIDYEDLEVSVWSGIKAKSLSVASPPRFASHAPEFLRVEGFEVDAALWSLPIGELEIDAVRIQSVHVAMVVDESGATTISELFPPSNKPKKDPPDPSSPLSHTMKKMPKLSVDKIEIASITGELFETSGVKAVRTTSVSKLGIRGEVASGEDGLMGTNLMLSSPPVLSVIHTAAEVVRTASLTTRVSVAATDEQSVDIDVAVMLNKQNFIEAKRPSSKLLAATLRAEFSPANGETIVRLTSFDAIDESLTATAEASIRDGDALAVTASAKVRGDINELPIVVPGVTLDRLKLALDAKDLSYQDGQVDGVAALTTSLAALDVERPDQAIAVKELSLQLDGKFSQEASTFEDIGGALTGSAAIASASAEAGGQKVAAAGFKATLRGDLDDSRGPQSASAAVSIGVDSAELADGKGAEVQVVKFAAKASTEALLNDLLNQRVDTFAAQVSSDAIIANDGAGTRANIEMLSADAAISGLEVDETQVAGATGDANVGLTVASLRATSAGERYVVSRLATRFELPLTLTKAKGDIAIASLRTREQSARGVSLDLETSRPMDLAPDSPSDSSLSLRGKIGGLRAGENAGRLPKLVLSVAKSGRDRYQVELDATASSLLAKSKPVPGPITARVRGDAVLSAPKLDATVLIRGQDGATVKAALDAKVGRGARLTYAASASAERLEAFAGQLKGLTPEGTTVKLAGATMSMEARGNFSGVLRKRRTGFPTVARDPVVTARGSQSVDISLVGLDYRGPEMVVAVPDIAINASSEHGKGGAGQALLSIKSSAADYQAESDAYKARGFAHETKATFDQSPGKGLTSVVSTTTVGSAEQSIFPEYQVEDMSIVAKLDIDRLRSVFLRELVVDNPISGTRLTALGAIEQTGATSLRTLETIPGREALTLEGRLTQKLDHLGRWGFADEAEGSVVVPFRLESGDLLSYRVVAKLMATNVTYIGKDAKIAIRDLNGVIPMVEEIALLPTGVVVIPGPTTSPLSRTRFFDVNPFLDSDDYITAESIKFGGETIGPIAGNVRLARAVFSIDQLQVGYRSGQISGQVRADYREGDPIVDMRLNLTGVKPEGSGEVLDANASLSFVPRTLSVDGKIQIVRIGRDHLLEVLNILDPYRETANINKVRLGLKVGFPKFVRIKIRDGAIDAKVELGGVGKLVRIDEIRAVPLGPIMAAYVAPALEGLLPALMEAPAEGDADPEEVPVEDP